jgi:hypothetical protein
MAIHTQQSLSGFIATDPQLSFNANGEARLHERISSAIPTAVSRSRRQRFTTS